MSLKLHFGGIAMCCWGFALPALAQLDSSMLRAKFGPPLNRETFHMPAGFDLIVDYGASNQVCKLEVPALMPAGGKASNVSVMRQRMYDFLAELTPYSIRGVELGRLTSVMSTISLSSVEYEHVIFSELQHADQPFGANTITVTFKNGNCPSLSGR
jgi:hypothetical protein